MAQRSTRVYRIQARDSGGKPVQRYIHAGSGLGARRKAASLASLRGATILSVQAKKNFAYKVFRGDKAITGIQSAYSRSEVVSALEKLGFRIAYDRRALDIKMGASTGEIVSFIGTSAKLLEQKMPYVEVLKIMSNHVRDANLKGALREIIQDLKNGVDSKEAFSRHLVLSEMPFGAASSNYARGVERLKGTVGLPAYTFLPNSEYPGDYLGSESARDNLRGQKGNNPDRLLRSRNSA